MGTLLITTPNLLVGHVVETTGAPRTTHADVDQATGYDECFLGGACTGDVVTPRGFPGTTTGQCMWRQD